jgi:hypothetical protein
MRDAWASLCTELATIWREMAGMWEYMIDHDRMQRQAIRQTVQAVVRKVRDGL